MATIKSYGAIAVMLGCFFIVYPRFMHPIVANIMGMGGSKKPVGHHDDHANMPHGYKENPSAKRDGVRPDDMRRHMKHGAHPGMRAAAEMQRGQQSQGSGRGMMGVVLPMYAVGIVLYLGYTLYKVFNKTNSKQNDNRYESNRRYSSQSQRKNIPDPSDFRDFDEGSGSHDTSNFLYDDQHRQNLEDLLTRVDDKNVSAEEMRVLQKRLEETEAQMTKILQAMRGVNTNVNSMAGEPMEEAEGNKTEQDATSTDQTEEATSNSDETKTKEEGEEVEESAEETEEEEDRESMDKDDDSCDEEEVSGEEKEEEVQQEAVDQVIGDKESNSKDETRDSSVRQRNVNVKSNEQ